MKVSPELRHKVILGFDAANRKHEEKDAVNEMMESREPIQQDNLLRRGQQKILYISKELGILIDKYEVDKLKGRNTIKYKQLFNNILANLEQTSDELRRELQ
jgi:hypothetical protein